MNDRPRVLFFCPVAYFKGGAERSLMDLIANPAVEAQVAVPALGPISDKMTSLDIKVHVVSFDDVEQIHRPFTFAKGVRAAKSAISAVRSLRRICAVEGIQIVHCNGLKAHVIGAGARIFGRPLLVLHIRDIPLTRAEHIVWKVLRRAADRLVLVSRACWPDRRLPANAVVVHNGIEIPSDRPLQPFLPAKPLRLGFVGRIDTAKGLHLLIAWMREAREAGLDLVLTVRGRFDSNDPDYESGIRRLIADAGLQDQVRLEAFVAEPEAVYANIDVMCVPSHIPDPLPRSVMEPMAYGIPVIAYPAGGIPEMIEHRKTGFLARDAREFIEAVRTILGSGQTVSEITANARAKIRDEFSYAAIHLRLGAIYRQMLQAKPGPSSGASRSGAQGPD